MTDAATSPPVPAGFWSINTDSEIHIGARHRCPRSVGPCLAAVIWCTVTAAFVSSCVKNPNTINVAEILFLAWMGVSVLRSAADSLFGRTEIRIRPGDAELIEGIGPLTNRSRFDPTAVTAVTEHIADERMNHRYVQLASPTPIYFGVRWSDHRRHAVIGALKSALHVPYNEPLAVDERDRRTSAAAAEHPTAVGPPGTWTVTDGQVLRLGARNWEWTLLLFAGFACFWNATVISMAVSIVQQRLYWALLFIAVFAAFGLLLVWSVLYAVLGRVEVAIAGNEATVFTGFGRFGSTQRFQPSRVTGIRRHYQRGAKGGTTVSLVIEADRDLMLGGTLTAGRREWLRTALAARLLTHTQASRRQEEA